MSQSNSHVFSLALKALERSRNAQSNRGDIALFHYTNTDVLIKIMENCCMRATNVFYLNDATEIKYGITLLKKLFEFDSTITYLLNELEDEMQIPLTMPFSISFTNKSDELHQWITYAKESGVCIEFDKDLFIGKQDSGTDKGSMYFGIEQIIDFTTELKADNLYSIMYDKESLTLNHVKDSLNEALRELDVYDKSDYERTFWPSNDRDSSTKQESNMKNDQTDVIKAYLLALASFYKEDGYKGESETRVLFLPPDEPVVEYFRKDNGILKPYMSIQFLRKESDNNLVKICPIKSVTIGPSGVQDQIFCGVVDAVMKEKNRYLHRYDEEYVSELLKAAIEKCKIASNSHSEEVERYYLNKWMKIAKTCYRVDHKSVDEIIKNCNVELEGYSKANEMVKGIVDQSFLKEFITPFGVVVKRSDLSFIF